MVKQASSLAGDEGPDDQPKFMVAMWKKGDPSIPIRDIENVELVFPDGLGFNSAKLLESVKGRFGLS
jgi:hypothetical protein